jgi:hypothetical protein
LLANYARTRSALVGADTIITVGTIPGE